MLSDSGLEERSVGFTGSRNGLTAYQMNKIYYYIDKLLPDVVHHGDCVGADAIFNDICHDRRVSSIEIHPPNMGKLRAFKGINDEVAHIKSKPTYGKIPEDYDPDRYVPYKIH